MRRGPTEAGGRGNGNAGRVAGNGKNLKHVGAHIDANGEIVNMASARCGEIRKWEKGKADMGNGKMLKRKGPDLARMVNGKSDSANIVKLG